MIRRVPYFCAFELYMHKTLTYTGNYMYEAHVQQISGQKFINVCANDSCKNKAIVGKYLFRIIFC